VIYIRRMTIIMSKLTTTPIKMRSSEVEACDNDDNDDLKADTTDTSGLKTRSFVTIIIILPVISRGGCNTWSSVIIIQ